MLENTYIQTSITPDKAVRLLGENGMPVSVEQAAGILQFLGTLAEVITTTPSE